MRDDRIERLFDDIARDGAAYAIDVHGRTEFGWHADTVMNTGSAFKVTVALEVFSQAHRGQLDLDETLTFTPEKYPGAAFTIADAVEMMMRVSDNGATSALMQRVGQSQIMRHLSDLRLHQTFIGPDVCDELDGIFAHLDQLAGTAGLSS